MTYTHHVTRRARLAALLAIGTLLDPAMPRAQAVQRSMYVTVVDKQGSPVENLGPTDFEIREDNAPREILKVEPAVDPMQIAVLVDNSQASSEFIRDVRVGLETFITNMTNGTNNQLSIVALADRPTIVTDTTSSRETLLKGVGRIFSQQGSGNYLLDGILQVCKGFTKREAARPVIVAITTEGPEYSSRTYQDVLSAVRTTVAALHVITLGRPAVDVLSDAGRNRTTVLEEGPRASGGARESLRLGSRLPVTLEHLAAQLNHQYRITYARPQTLIPPEQVTVRATRPDVTARGTPVREITSKERP
jgi:VWFA-related protein